MWSIAGKQGSEMARPSHLWPQLVILQRVALGSTDELKVHADGTVDDLGAVSVST